jgi:hypothetical protein
MMARIHVESETKKKVEITVYEALVLDAKLFELKQLVDDQRRLIDFLRVDEKAKERAAVVAWLRLVTMDARDLYHTIADHIERGEHRREEEP